MLGGRLRRRALALLGALLLVIFIWPPCCATMPKPLPALLPAVPEIDLPTVPVPTVAIVAPVQQQQTAGKSRKSTEQSRFMSIFSTTTAASRESDGKNLPGESGGRSRAAMHNSVVSSANASDSQSRALNLQRPESDYARSSIAEPIDKNKSHEQQSATATGGEDATQPVKLDNVVGTVQSSTFDSEKPYHPEIHQAQITHSPTVFNVLFQKPPTQAAAAAADGDIERQQHLKVNDHGVDQNAVNQSVFNISSRSIDSSSPALDDDKGADDDGYYSSRALVLSRIERSASADPGEFGFPRHRHRHQHYLTGNSTLTAAGAHGRTRGAPVGRHHHHHIYHHHHQQQQQQQYRNATAFGADVISGGSGSGGEDQSNLERNERSANLSHITGATRKIQLYIKNRYLQLLADGTVNGTHDDQSDFTILQRTTVAAGQIRIQSVATCLFLCMDTCGTVYGSKDFTEDCVFNEQIEQHHYNTYSSTQHSNARRTLYLALNKTGQPRKIQIPVNRTLGKLATYTKALTQTVAHDRVERLISRLFGANHVRHGLKQLCESGRALQDLTAKVMRPRPACGAARPAVASQPATTGGTKEVSPPVTPGGNKDKDTKDTLRKKKKKRRKCREDEPAGEHCFRPQAGSIGTNSGRRKPPGPTKSQRCSPDDGDCVVSPSSSSGSSSGSSSSSSSSNNPNSANSVSSSSSSNRASTTPATVPNVVASAGAGPKKKVVKKVNNRNTPNVNNKKPKKNPVGGGSGGPAANKKTKHLHNISSSSSISSGSPSSSSSISSSSVPSAVRGRGKTTSTSTTITTTAKPTATTPISTTKFAYTTPWASPSPANFMEDTSQSDDELIEAEIDMDDLMPGSTELIEEDDIDEGFLPLVNPTASPWHEQQPGISNCATPSSPSVAGAAATAAATTVPVLAGHACSSGRFHVTYSLLSLCALLIASGATTASATHLLYL
ncbi:uncharacterized protein LOC129731363 [Wyeomyia smithii]|uniref:uncharacterized protein LOC129731363 n=1 Tax=Wyeomyia smithii TaxID=174621 RepID=UPI002467E1F1|nr:uncharacterized protein LOC129731363 [Wyeomyia smithii]